MQSPSLLLATPATGFLDMAGRIHETRTAAERASIVSLVAVALAEFAIRDADGIAEALVAEFDIGVRRHAS